jgi:hypothetical protein
MGEAFSGDNLQEPDATVEICLMQRSDDDGRSHACHPRGRRVTAP